MRNTAMPWGLKYINILDSVNPARPDMYYAATVPKVLAHEVMQEFHLQQEDLLAAIWSPRDIGGFFALGGR